MKAASTGALSGCLVWVLTFFLLSACICPLSVAVGTFTSFSSGDFIAGLVSPYLCPSGSTGKIRTFETTTTDDNGNSVPTTGYEMICVDASGTEVANTGPVYALIWVGVLAVVGLVLTAVLAIFLAVPAGALIARWMNNRRLRSAGAIGPA